MLWSENQDKALQNLESFIRQRFVYMDEQIETLQTPEYMLKGLEINHHIVGDCDDISTLYAAILTCMGFKSRFVAIRSLPDPGYDHVFVQVQKQREWITYDMTVPPNTILEYYGKVEIAV